MKTKENIADALWMTLHAWTYITSNISYNRNKAFRCEEGKQKKKSHNLAVGTDYIIIKM